MEQTLKRVAENNLTRVEYVNRIVSYVKDNPYFQYREVDRFEGVVIGCFQTEGVEYIFRIDKGVNGELTKPISLERNRDSGIGISESAIQLLYEHVRVSYTGYIINKYGGTGSIGK